MAGLAGIASVIAAAACAVKVATCIGKPKQDKTGSEKGQSKGTIA